MAARKAGKSAAKKRPKAGKAARARAAPKKRAAAKKPAPRPKRVRRKAATAAPRRKDGRPGNWPALSPYMTVRDAAASLAFYEGAFGFQVEGTVMRDGEGRVMHAGMRLGEACIMFAPQGMNNDMRAPVDAGGPGSLSLYVYVPDVDAHFARAERAGAEALQPPADQFWGDRIAIFRDPDGYHWTFATNIGAFDPSQAPH